MCSAHGEKGAALVTALMLTMLALVIALALLYIVTAGSRVSASQKRYRSALTAAQGGVELVTREIIPLVLGDGTTEKILQEEFALIGLKFTQAGCLKQKLTTPTASWSAICAGTGSGDPAKVPDISFTLGGGAPDDPGYQVSMKVVDASPGNSDSGYDELLQPGNPVAGTDQTVHPQHVPGIYNLAVQGVGGIPREKARLSVLYAY